MMRSISTTLTLFVLFTQLNLGALLAPLAAGSPCGRAETIYLPIVNAMAQPTILENLEQIMRSDAAFPYDAIITQIFTNTVAVKPVGSRTIIRDVAVAEGIDIEALRIGYPVRLGHSASKVTLTEYFEQFADPESVNYAGLGVKVPSKPTVSVKATPNGWLLTWPAVANATRYLIYQNDDATGDSPELVQTLPVQSSPPATYSLTLSFDPPFTYFAVQACNGLLEGDVSNWATDATPPAAPTWKSHAYQTGGHYLAWGYANTSLAADVMTYTLYRNTSPTDAGATEVVETANLEALLDYVDGSDYFGVQATDWSGTNHSAIVWTGPYDPTPATPANFAANMVQGGGFKCTWDATAKAMIYEVQGRDKNDGLSTWSTQYQGSDLMTGVIRNDSNEFRIRAIGYDGSSSAWSAVETDDKAPPPPTLAIVNGAKQVTVGLAANDTSHIHVGFSHYVLEVADGSAGEGATTLDTHATFESFPRIFAGETGVTTYYRLTPYDWAGNVGTASDWTPGTPITFGDGGAIIQDKFDTYGGSTLAPLDSLYWLSLAKVEQSESWVLNSATWVSTNISEGAKGIRVVSVPGLPYLVSLAKSMNLSQEGRFTNDDYLVIQTNIANYGWQKVTVTLYNSGSYPGGSGYRRTFDTTVDFGSPFVVKRSEFVAYGASPNWATIAGIQFYVEHQSGSVLDMTLDDIRIVKADPDNAAAYNDTGKAWDYAISTDVYDASEWHIYAGNRTGEPGKPFGFGQVNHSTSPDHWYLAHKPVDTNVVSGTIQAGLFHKENGQNGLAFYIKDVTPDAWTMYAVETDNVGDTVKLVKWVDGVRTELGSASFAFSFAAGGTTGQTVWIGADFSDYDTDGGRIKVYASTVEGNLIQAGNLKISVQDTEVGSGGTVGLLSYQANVRFVNFTAGSPAHADVADVAKALDGPIVAGDVRRVHYNLDLNRFEYTDDGSSFSPVSSGLLGGYALGNGSGQVPLNNGAANTNLVAHYLGATLFDGPALRAVGEMVYKNNVSSGLGAGWYTVPFTGVFQDMTIGAAWSGGNPTVVQTTRTGWGLVFGQATITPSANTDNVALQILVNGAAHFIHQERRATSTQSVTMQVSGWYYFTAGVAYYIQLQALGGSNWAVGSTGTPWTLLGLLSLERNA
ncbi:MAG: hypothetical protein KJ077_35745 [Anaerolineae bacterium]|nr:hypothetical protein [Anaerolineae bacterium]